MFSFFQRICLVRVPSLLMLGAVYVIYVLVGGVVFWQLEGDRGELKIAGLKEERSRLLHKFPCLDQAGLEELAMMVQGASKRGLSLKGNKTAEGFWRFTSSAVFAATVVTTIGYGNISPSTAPGQIFCVLFALFGIPLNVVVLNRVGKYMLATERNVCDFLEKKTNRRGCVRVCVHALSFVVLAVLYFVVPMLLFQRMEGWSYSQAVYYCFITLSTIGFGDYVADDNPDLYYPEWYSCLLGAWIFFGLAWLALLINHTIDLLEGLSAYLKQRHGAGDHAGHAQEETKEPPKDQPECMET